MEVRFWGVRGSVAVSGEDFVSTGGNTTCVEVTHEGHRLVLDGGVWDGRTLLDAAWVDDMLTERARVHPEVGYGYLWWRIPVTVDGEMLPCWAMLGNGGNLVLLSERHDAVVVVQAANYNEPTAQQWSMVPVRMALTLLEATHETSAERPAQAP